MPTPTLSACCMTVHDTAGDSNRATVQEVVVIVRKISFTAFVDERGIPRILDAFGHIRFERLRGQAIQRILCPEEREHLPRMVILDVTERVTADTNLSYRR